VAASHFYFEETADYSSWACGLLEDGHDSDNIRILAGLLDEDNLFELRQWHSRVLQDLGFGEMDASGIFLAHLRGHAEEYLEGKRDFKDINRHFHELRSDKDDELLEPFETLHYGFWDFEALDMSDLGIASLDDFPRVTTDACLALISKIQAEQSAADQPATRPEPKSENNQKPQPESEAR
jgi:hypothetical protein